jgi:hypothetical protein
MKISIDMISDMGNLRSSNLEQLIFDYGKLKQRISKLDDQDEHTETLNLKLKLIEDQFNLSYYFPFNFSSIDSLMEERQNRCDIKEQLELKENLTETEELILTSTLGKIGYYDELILLKGKTDFLYDIGYYTDHPDKMICLIF